MRFDPPKTQDELNAILAVCKLTAFGPEEQTSIANVYAKHIDPRAPFCGGCGDAARWQRTIAQIATQRSADWQASINQPAINPEHQSPKKEDSVDPSFFDTIITKVNGFINPSSYEEDKKRT